MSYPRLAARLYNAPLLITPEKAEVIERVFRAHLEGSVADLPKYEPLARVDMADLQAMTATSFRRTAAGYLRSDSGVALIQVLGTLVQRGSGMDAMSGLESYDNVGSQIAAAVADPMVRGILMEFDSPGGEGNGVAALGEAIRAANGVKPVVAHANEMAFSAAYWLASSAGELYVPKTGMVGSVGVIMLHVDQSQMNAKRGIQVTHIIAGARKADFSPHQPLSDRAAADAQAIVDRLYGQFVDHVAAMRGIDPQAVRNTEAGLLNPDQAMSAEMVDGVGTLGDALARLDALMRDPKKSKTYGQRAASAQLSQENAMTQEKDKPAAPAVAAATPDQLAEARAEGEKAGRAAAAAEAQKAGADTERARIDAILGCDEAKERPTLAHHLALKTAHSIDDAKALLAVAAKETAGKTNALAEAMKNVANVEVGVSLDGGSGQAKPRKTSAEIYAQRRQQVHAVK